MNKEFETLFEHYLKAPEIYHASNYWKNYEKDIVKSINNLDVNELRSGKYSAFSHFGFNDVIYRKLSSIYKKIIRKIIFWIVSRYLGWKSIFPYELDIDNIRYLAYHHCSIYADITNSLPIQKLSMSEFGHPLDKFKIDGNVYSMLFLSYFIRYCFANKEIKLKGNETVVELGSGSGYQIEILKKLYPGLTLLCFDLPAQLYLCEQYLTNVFGSNNVISSNDTLNWKDLSKIEKGKIHFFGNWKFDLLKSYQFDLFWNAASFGEMEPDIVKNYISIIWGNVNFVYLLQAQRGKEIHGVNSVRTPITFEDYLKFLDGYKLCDSREAMKAHKKLLTSGGYFEGIWKFSKSDIQI